MSIYNQPYLTYLLMIAIFSYIIFRLARTKDRWILALLLHVAMYVVLYAYVVKTDLITRPKLWYPAIAFPYALVFFSDKVLIGVKLADFVIMIFASLIL